MIKVAIIGATGYTGADSISIILRHPEAELTYLTSSATETIPLTEVHPQFAGRVNLDIEPLNFDILAERADVALCCLPHKVSMSFVPQMLSRGVKVIDFSADYRLKNIEMYEKYYVPHTDKSNIENAVYGLPELYRDEIKNASLIANPGCFPTSAILATAPLLRANLIDTKCIVVNSVSGATGAGKKPGAGLHFPSLNENLRAYGIGTHRHTPEMEEVAGYICNKQVGVLFQPHIGPYDRGILSSIYCDPTKDVTTEELKKLFKDSYKNEPFVQIMDTPSEIKNVASTNYCHIHVAVVKGKIAIFSAIDNLYKGASGQAIQNMNIMFGLDEKMGLE